MEADNSVSSSAPASFDPDTLERNLDRRNVPEDVNATIGENIFYFPWPFIPYLFKLHLNFTWPRCDDSSLSFINFTRSWAWQLTEWFLKIAYLAYFLIGFLYEVSQSLKSHHTLYQIIVNKSLFRAQKQFWQPEATQKMSCSWNCGRCGGHCSAGCSGYEIW